MTLYSTISVPLFPIIVDLGINATTASWVDAMVNGEFTQLTRKHSIKVAACFLCSVEDVGMAVGEEDTA